MRKPNRRTVLLLSIATGSLVAPACGGTITGSGDDTVNADDTDAGSGGAGSGGYPYAPGMGGRPYVPGTGGAHFGGAGGAIAPGLVGVLPYPPGTGGASAGGAYPVGSGGMPVGVLPYPVDAGPAIDAGGPEGEEPQADGGSSEPEPSDPSSDS